MADIITLPDHIITKIAAGQVIERPAYAVKELIENALDAGATQIHIDIEEAGMKRIRVRDNGVGMNKKNIQECYKHHTTSKVYEEDDLTHITTLGFRGEALASIAGMSTVTIQSRPRDCVSGYTIMLRKGISEELSVCGMPQGTIIEVRDIFSCVPARKKFLKSPSTEFRHIIDVVSFCALAFPAVGFRLVHNGKKVINTPSNQTQPDRVASIMGMSLYNHLIPLGINTKNKPPHPYVMLEGYVSRPQLSYGSAKQFIFVNNRFIEHAAITRTMKQAYGSLLEPRQYPVVLLFLQIPSQMVDVNIHPRKQEVRFYHETDVLETISDAVTSTLGKSRLVYTGFNHGYGMVREKPTQSYAGKLLKDEVSPWNVKNVNKTEKPSIFQIHNTFLIFQTKTGMSIVDQHAAHERILYEQFSHMFKEKQKKDRLFFLEKPIIMQLSARDSASLEAHQETFASLGFTIEAFGDNTWRVISVPFLFQDRPVDQLIMEVLEDISDQANIQSNQPSVQVNKLLSYLACRTAIKAGDPLTQEEMQRLVEKLDTATTPYTCPHGRPVTVEISVSDLYRLFKRV